MMDKKPILSICIPTWNRWYALQDTLKSIINQNEFKSGDIEIVISDNASTDETEKEIKKICDKYVDIRYFRNEENIGPMKNISKVMTLGNGEYLWGLGSDDLICSGGIEKTINIIEKYQPDAIIHTYKHENKINYLKNEYFKSVDNLYFFGKQQEYFNFLGDQFSYDMLSYNGFIEYLLSVFSVAVIRKDFYYKLKNKIIEERGTDFFDKFNFIHVLCAHYDEVDKGIVLVHDNYLDYDRSGKNKELAKKVAWTPCFSISNDSCFVYNYLIERYNLNKNFKKLRNKNNFYWTMGAISNFPFIEGIKKLLKKMGLFDKILSIIKKL